MINMVAELTDSIDPDEMGHTGRTHLNIHCLPSRP